jgi:hypothetical protein
MTDYYNNYAEKVNNDPTRLNALRTNIEGIASNACLFSGFYFHTFLKDNKGTNDISRYAENKIADISIIK